MFLKSEIGTDCTDRRKADSSNYSHLINLYLRCSDLIGREIENLGRRQKINRTHFQNVVKPRNIPYAPQKHWKRKKREDKISESIPDVYSSANTGEIITIKRSGASRRKLARKLSSISIPFVKPPCISPSWPG